MEATLLLPNESFYPNLTRAAHEDEIHPTFYFIPDVLGYIR
jgi:hypothetical protein